MDRNVKLLKEDAMFVPRFHIVLFALCVGLMQIGSAQGATNIYIPTETQTTNATNYNVNPAINNQAVLTGTTLPGGLWQTGSTMAIMAARGEYEPATFVLDTDTTLTAVDVQLGTLTGTLGEGTLAAETLDVRVAQPYYSTQQGAALPWVLTHDPAIFDITGGTTNVLTKAAVDTTTLQPADVTDRQQFWITAHIPDNAQPGTYSAPVTVTSTNGLNTALTLEVRVPNLELKEPDFEYSVFYPAFLEGTFETGQDLSFLTDTQYVNETRNMQEHGLTNPVFYDGVRVNPDGTLDYTLLERYIGLRQQAGMSMQGKPLYLPDNPLKMVERDLTPAEYAQNVDYTQQIVAWANQNGYGDVYFFAVDEADAAGLLLERDSFQSIHDGGGKIWASVLDSDYFAAAGDLVDAPVFFMNGGIDGMLTPGIQNMIDAVHQNGYKILTYMDPIAGEALPDRHRRFRGVGLWKIGLDGTMTWAYTHINGSDVTFAGGEPLPDLLSDFVFRGEEAPFDTLGFEGFREGYDDARYLATLLDAMSKASALGQHLTEIGDAQTWLNGLNAANADLDAVRQEMATLIELIAPVPGDFNADGNVTTADYDIMKTNFLSTGNVWNQNGELTGPGGIPDGVVDLFDFFEFKENIFPGGASAFASALASSVPEPGSASLMILALSALALVGRRRKGVMDKA